MGLVMEWLPFWSVRPESESMRAAGRWQKALMFAAGDTSTTVFTVAIATQAARQRVPGSRAFFAFVVGWSAIKTVATTHNAKGDYAEALRALAS